MRERGNFNPEQGQKQALINIIRDIRKKHRDDVEKIKEAVENMYSRHGKKVSEWLFNEAAKNCGLKIKPPTNK